MKKNRDKEIKNLIKNIILKTEYKNVNKVFDDNNCTEGFSILLKGDEKPHDPLHEEVWDDDVDIKVFRRDTRYDHLNDSYLHVYDLLINDDRIRNYKYGKYLYYKLKSKYSLKKKDEKVEKISRILKKLGNN